MGVRLRGAENIIPQTRWAAVATRRIESLKSSEWQLAWRRGCYNNGRTEDGNDASGVRRAWVASRVKIGLEEQLPSWHDDDWTDLV